jgi:hypothetical protein
MASPANQRYEKGDALKFKVTFKDSVGALADPTEVTARLKGPAQDSIDEVYNGGAGNVIKTSLGKFEITQTLGQFEGEWSQRFEGTGAVQVSAEQKFSTNDSAF